MQQNNIIKNRRAQEEIAGFVVIVVIVAVILVVLLSLMITSPDKGAVESYEVESFLQASLQYTTICEDSTGFLSLQELIISCDMGENCLNENSCVLRDSTIKAMVENSWNINEQSAIKGYEFSILADDEEKLLISEGNKTGNYKGNFIDFTRRGRDYQVTLNIYE